MPNQSPTIDILPSDTLSLKQVLPPFLSLWNALEIPVNFKIPAQQLSEKLQSAHSVDDLMLLCHDFNHLIQGIKKHTQQEKKATADLLINLTEQLSELSLKASGASHAAQVSAQQRNLLDQSMSAQMSDLEKSSSEATTLDHLKDLINKRLFNIRHEIKEHLRNEAHQRLENEQQLLELTLKIKALESESNELKSKLTAAYTQATRDKLTNLPNRLAYEEALPIEIARWQRYDSPLTMAIWDIDYFKTINDTYGHAAGDKTLSVIAKLLSKHCRKTDFVARLGGEEFVMLLSNTTAESALLFANKIRLLVEKTNINTHDNIFNLTISCGISEFKTGDTQITVFERADKALYESKTNGRNQCSILQ